MWSIAAYSGGATRLAILSTATSQVVTLGVSSPQHSTATKLFPGSCCQLFFLAVAKHGLLLGLRRQVQA